MSKCLECKYYDKEKHYCPFYCQLIRETLDEAISFELERIKEEIRTIPQVHIKTGAMSLDKELVVPLNKVVEKLDKHIAELEGEENDTN